LPDVDALQYILHTMTKFLALFALLALSAPAQQNAQQKMQAPDLIALAKSGKPGLSAAITASFDAKALQEGTAWIGRGPDFFFAIQTEAKPSLVIDDGAPAPMKQITGSKLWYATATDIKTGTSHTFHYLVNAAELGGSVDMPAFGPMSSAMPGVPQGHCRPYTSMSAKSTTA
jgi:hypothetical protein